MRFGTERTQITKQQNDEEHSSHSYSPFEKDRLKSKYRLYFVLRLNWFVVNEMYISQKQLKVATATQSIHFFWAVPDGTVFFL